MNIKHCETAPGIGILKLKSREESIHLQYEHQIYYCNCWALWLCILIRKFHLQALCSEFMAESAPALCLAVTKHLGDSEGLKNSGDQNW